MNDETMKIFVPGNPPSTREDFAVASQAMNALPIPWVEPIDISKALVFLASDDARYITGVALPVDAGSARVGGPGGNPPPVAGHQHRWASELPSPERDIHRWEPQIALRQLARPVVNPRRRVHWNELRAQLPDTLLENSERARPADPLGDHRRRHLRPLRQKCPDLRLHHVDDRAARRTLGARWLVGGQRSAHRVPADAQLAGDRLDRHLLRPMKTTDLRPVLHLQHPSLCSERVQVHPSPEGQLSAVVSTSTPEISEER